MDDSTQTRRGVVDGIITRAAHLAIEETGVSLETLLDRIVTFAAAHAVLVSGPENAANAFREIGDKIRAGAFAHLEHRNASKH